jgi:hypothetical protein
VPILAAVYRAPLPLPPDCAVWVYGRSGTFGSQVVVVNSSGTVIGNGTLAAVSSGPGIDNFGEEDVFSFKLTVPGGLARYGIQVGGTSHGTVWESAAQMQSGPALDIDESTGGL